MLAGRTVLVTAGPTREFFDPVRFFSNPSTGKMGYAVARALAAAGARVRLVSGPVALAAPPGVARTMVVSAAQMYAACRACWDDCDALIATAAVADYAPAVKAPAKIKKRAEDLHLRLVATPDILSLLSAEKGARVTVGFAAETDRHLDHAREKVARKRLDLIVVNDLTRADSGFETDTNKVWLLFADGRTEELPTLTKDEVAARLTAHVAALLAGRGGKR